MMLCVLVTCGRIEFDPTTDTTAATAPPTSRLPSSLLVVDAGWSNSSTPCRRPLLAPYGSRAAPFLASTPLAAFEGPETKSASRVWLVIMSQMVVSTSADAKQGPWEAKSWSYLGPAIAVVSAYNRSLDSRCPFLGIPGLAQLLCTLALAFLGPTTVVDRCSRHFYERKSFCRIYQQLILNAGLSSINVNLTMYTRSGRGVHRETIEITGTSGGRVACWGLMYTTSIHKTHLPLMYTQEQLLGR